MIMRPFFQIPYWNTKLLNFSSTKKILKNLISEFPEQRNPYDNFSSNVKIDRKEFIKKFEKIIDKELNQLSISISKKLKITDAWSVTYKKGDFHPPHNHGYKKLSGILYLDFPKGSADTEYVQPFPDLFSDLSIYSTLPNIEEGTINIVPSFLSHFTYPQKVSKAKQIIAWDMIVI